MFNPSRSPPSRRYIWLHRSIRPLGAGVPVRPTTRRTFGKAILRLRKRWDFGLLKLDNSSMIIMSNGKAVL